MAAFLTSVAVADVFLGGSSLDEVAPALVAITLLAVARAPLLFAADAFAQGASRRIKRRLRADLTAHLFALGPMRRGELFETTAVPNIRLQAQQLAETLIEELGVG